MARRPPAKKRARRTSPPGRRARASRAERRRAGDADYVLYTDGGANPNPGPGGWGVVLMRGDGSQKRELSGGERHTTNNRMELLAAIRGLAAVPEGSKVEIVTDSDYLRRGITEWVRGWQQRGWQRLEGGRLRPVKNRDLWEELVEAESRHRVTWHWIRGHSGHPHNERADRLAAREIDRLRGVEDREQELDAEAVLRVTCSHGSGAWAARIERQGEETLHSGRLRDTTANRLDLVAAIETLALLPDGSRVALATASDYLRRGALEWLPAWKHRGWVTVSGSPVQNRELWQQLDRELARRRVVFRAPREEELARLTAALEAAADER